MKEMFIIFIILLVLLLIMSSLGGSIRVQQENFEDDMPLYEESIMPHNVQPWVMNPSFIPEESKYKPPPRIYAKCLQQKQNKRKEPLLEKNTDVLDTMDEEDPVDEEDVSPYAMDGDFAPV